jgi:hypothetical protein
MKPQEEQKTGPCFLCNEPYGKHTTETDHEFSFGCGPNEPTPGELAASEWIEEGANAADPGGLLLTERQLTDTLKLWRQEQP